MAEEVKINPRVTVQILSITIDSPITVCRGGIPVKLPNWERGKRKRYFRWLAWLLDWLGWCKPVLDLKDRRGSKRPGVFILPGEGNAAETDKKEKHNAGNQSGSTLDVKVKVKGLKAHETVTLTGTLAGFEFKGTIPGAHGGWHAVTKHVTVVPNRTPSHFRRIRGDMKWCWYFSNDENTSYPANPAETRMEMYWIYGHPGRMYKKGVWVEVLRLLAAHCYFGLKEKKYFIQRVVNYCFSGTFLKYDIVNCTSRYVDNPYGGVFKLRAFLEQVYPVCICNDQAGLVQTLLGALGINVSYAYMKPFGFLNKTNLIGRGKCNNTYFLGDNPAPEIVDINDERRYGFGIHVFCLWEKEENEKKEWVVLDSCAGPSVGILNKKRYVKESIDTKTELYGQRLNSRGKPIFPKPGKVTDIKKRPGIIDVHSIPCKGDWHKTLKNKEDTRIQGFINQVGLQQIMGEKRTDEDKGVVCNWLNPLDCPALTDGWEIKFEEILGGCDTALKEWVLVRDDEYLHIAIYYQEGSEDAQERLLTLTALIPLPKIPFEQKKKPESNYFQVIFNTREYGTFHNVCFVVESLNSSMDLTSITSWLQEQAESNLEDNWKSYSPKFHDVVCPQKIEVGEEVNIKVYPAEKKAAKSLQVDFFLTGEDCLQLVEEQLCMKPKSNAHFLLKFKGKSAGETSMKLVLVNKKNLLYSSRDIKIEVGDLDKNQV